MICSNKNFASREGSMGQQIKLSSEIWPTIMNQTKSTLYFNKNFLKVQQHTFLGTTFKMRSIKITFVII